MGLLKPKLNLLTHFLLPLSPITKEQTSCLHHSAEITLINYHLHLPSSGSKNPNTFLSADLQNITWAEVNLKFHSGYEQAGRGGEGCPGHNTRGAGVPPHHAAQFCNMVPSTQPHLPPVPCPTASPATAAPSHCPPRHELSVDSREENRAETTREEKRHCVFHQSAFWFGEAFLFRF